MRVLILIFIALSLTACRFLPREDADPTVGPATVDSGSPGAESSQLEPGVTATTQPPVTVEPTVLPATSAPKATESTEETNPSEPAGSVIPIRDDVRLAIAYRGADPAAATPQPAADYEVGSVDTYYIGNVDSNTVQEIEAQLMSEGEHAYFWFDLGEGSVEPTAQELEAITAAFDGVYETLFAYFGDSGPAGEKAHIVHASPGALCDDVDLCGLAGYFSARDMLPASVNPWSNERMMFVMNTQQFGGLNYLDVLAHELRHMLGAGYDAADEDWMVEGAAMLAEDLAGFDSLPQARGTLFLENTDQQLNSWTDGFTIPHYGQGYLVNRYLYDRLGEELYRDFTFSSQRGLSAVDAVAKSNGLELTGEGLWLDWLVAMAVHNLPNMPDRYRWLGPELGPVAATTVNNVPSHHSETVGQFAADYYELPSSGTFDLDFKGAPFVSLLNEPAPSGERFWYAQRANFSNPRLTREIDLRGVSSATHEYSIDADIEQGYDFAYVSVSRDDGHTWQALEAPGMQGLDPADDPSDSAFTGRFYTGRRADWIDEVVDLTPFAGETLLLRFEYVTDPILTFGGFALDDIAIPEIGFQDDAESNVAGWEAEGFTRASAALPQSWQLQLVTFDSDGQPSVELLPVSAEGTTHQTLTVQPGGRRPMLIVASTVPETLEKASYELALDG